MDTPLIISLSALALSILSPFATAWLNGRNRLKEKRMDIAERQRIRDAEFFEQHRAEVIESFVRSAMRATQNVPKSSDDTLDFGAACGEIYLYLDPSYWPDIDKAIQMVQARDNAAARTVLLGICKRLSEEKVRQPHGSVPDDAHK